MLLVLVGFQGAKCIDVIGNQRVEISVIGLAAPEPRRSGHNLVC